MQGSVFFSFPDGSGILYILQGTAEPPKAEGTVTEEIKCKTHHTQTLPVHNWLPRPQRYLIHTETYTCEFNNHNEVFHNREISHLLLISQSIKYKFIAKTSKRTDKDARINIQK